MSSAIGPAWVVRSGTQDPATVERLLGLLPRWFGIESANRAYVEAATRLCTYLACPGAPETAGDSPAGTARRPAVGVARAPTTQTAEDPAAWTAVDPVGVLLAERHFPGAAEIHLMAVDPAWHRRGAGRVLVAALEADLIADGVEFLQVKTLGPSQPDEGYAQTRQFYTRVGFHPLEEITDFWPGSPCLLMIKTLPPPQATPPPRHH
jgi:GNAT superfamily N-acetyltransferase